MSTYFISGHCDLSEEFQTHYKEAIDNELEDLTSLYVIGNARGEDSFTQKYLSSRVNKDSVTLYHLYSKPLNNYGGYPTVGGYTSYNKEIKV